MQQLIQQILKVLECFQIVCFCGFCYAVENRAGLRTFFRCNYMLAVFSHAKTSNRMTSTTKSGGGLSQTTRNSYSYGAVSVNEGKAEPANYASAFITTETVDGLVTGVTYQDGMGRTVRQQSDDTVTDYSYDLSGNTVTEYVKTGETEGMLTLHVVDKDGNETATLQNPVWNGASGCFDVGADTICETASYDKSGNLTSQTDGNGSQTGFAYDAEGRITGVTLQNGSDTCQTSYTYSEAGEDGAYRSYVTQTRTETSWLPATRARAAIRPLPIRRPMTLSAT